MTGRALDPLERPLDRILQALRERYADAYQADADRLGVWLAYCPACASFALDRRTLAIREQRRGGPVSLWCSGGCSEEAILAALYPTSAPSPIADPLVIGNLAIEVLNLRRQLAAA
jgi:hypothetical protein